MREDASLYAAGRVQARSVLVLPGVHETRPGILVLPDGFGLGEQAVRRARMLAQLGYVAIAADLYGDGRLAGGLSEAHALSQALRSDPDELRQRAAAGLDVLRTRSDVDSQRIAVIGYCFGGTCALELVRAAAPVSAAIVFHGALDTMRPAAARVRATAVLVCTGADDPLVPEAQILAFKEEMTAAQLDWQVHLYGGVKHNFTNPDSARLNRPTVAYDAIADRRSWQAMKNLLAEAFNGPARQS